MSSNLNDVVKQKTTPGLTSTMKLLALDQSTLMWNLLEIVIWDPNPNSIQEQIKHGYYNSTVVRTIRQLISRQYNIYFKVQYQFDHDELFLLGIATTISNKLQQKIT